MQLSDFDYSLPEELIARYPLPERTQSRLLVVSRQKKNDFVDTKFSQLIDYLNPNDLLILNDTRVMNARIMAKKATGGNVEIMIERVLDNQSALVYLGTNKKIKLGMKLFVDQIEIDVVERQHDLFLIQIKNDFSFAQLMTQYGQIPIPPYFKREAEDIDKERYQTIYAQEEGAVAAPTAGLHFDENLMQQLKNNGIQLAYVTLHVGAGTFQPIREENIQQAKLHQESVIVTEETCDAIKKTKQQNGRVIAVGTTSVRALETAAQSGKLKPYQGETQLFIYPGYEFNVIDGMITNFHLPKSSLLMLVAAFAGYENMMNAYQHAIQNHYRFYSYGDAMLIL